MSIFNSGSRHCDRFRNAARDGNLSILKEATKRDLNSSDDDGMTAAHWAAYDGRLDALRIITGRGSNPDLPDRLGQTALHHAVRRNHLHCVSFLVNFGCNVWALDDDGHSALDLAGVLGHDSIVRYLDSVLACHYAQDRKGAEKCKSKAIQDAERRLRKKEQQLERSLAELDVSNNKTSLKESLQAALKKYEGGKVGAVKSVPQRVAETLRLKKTKRNDKLTKCSTAPTTTTTAAVTSRRRCHSIAALSKTTSKDVLYGNPVSAVENADGGKANETTPDNSRALGLFDRPGFGSVSFRNLQVVTMFVTKPVAADGDDIGVAKVQSNANRQSCEIQEFLRMLGLEEHYPIFQREQISVDSLRLLTEKDLVDLGLPMGPRKLLMDAILNRMSPVVLDSLHKEQYTISIQQIHIDITYKLIISLCDNCGAHQLINGESLGAFGIGYQSID